MATEWNPRGSWYDHEASAIAVFEMTDDIVYSYRGSWCSEGLNTQWESSWRIIGEKGSVIWDGADGFKAQAVTGSDGFNREKKDLTVPYDPKNIGLAGHAGCIDEFMKSIASKKAPQTVCTDNIKSLAMVHAAIESAVKGRKVSCD